MKKLLFVLLLSMALGACRYPDYFVTWGDSCPGFPTLAEAEKVLEEHSELFERMKDEGLMWSTHIVECPQGAYLNIDHGGEWQVPLMLEIMDEENARSEGYRMFFGIPFRFANV